ncbi:nuclear factor related to kappa-B-binding protein isoform X7 [Malaya genurostris]|uniref:nuclear factor related to kappa-B-binding protein isoform X7 n=1 Tax=Malaya genurostris TaxID=325434 RepID=UPI0026F3E23D|nr:nuclear factor related to kappa-B-binding protein isoform X7 [Malaya genurostris]
MNKNISGEDFVSSEYSSNSLSNDISLSSSNTSVKRRLKKKFESTQITTEVIKLPRELCENEDIFSAFFSMETWYSLSNTIRKHLSLFLPMFTNNIEPENLITVEALLSNKNTRFGMCPLRKLQKHIEAGNCIPDIFLRSDRVSKAKRREQRYRECKKIAALTHEIFASRDRVLREVYDDTCFLKMSSMQGSQTRKYCSNSFNFTMRAKKRYLREIMSIMGHFGSKEVFSGEDDCPVDITNMPRRQRRWFGASQSGSSSFNQQIMNTFGNNSDQTSIDYLIGPTGKLLISDYHYRNLLICHKRRKIEELTSELYIFFHRIIQSLIATI